MKPYTKTLIACWMVVLATAACKADANIQKPTYADPVQQCMVDAIWNPNIKTKHEYAQSVIDDAKLDGNLIACAMLDPEVVENPFAMMFLPALPGMVRQQMKGLLDQPDEPMDWENFIVTKENDDGEAQ